MHPSDQTISAYLDNAVAVTERRHLRQHVKAVIRHRRLDRCVLLAPSGQQAVEADGIDHRAGKNVRADFGALLDDDDGNIRRNLLEPDRRRQARGTGANHDDVEFHGLAGGQFVGQ